jgi:hypothetical protein
MDFVLLAATLAIVMAGALIMMVVQGLIKTKAREGRLGTGDVLLGCLLISIALLFAGLSLLFLGGER